MNLVLLQRLVLLWLVFIVPLVVLKPANDYVLQPKIAVAMTGALLAGAALVVSGRWRGALRSPLAAPLAAVLLAAALAVPGAINLPQAARGWGTAAGWALLAVAAAACRPPWGKLLLVTALSVGVQLVIALMQLSGKWIVGHGEQFGPGRVYATLGNPSFLGVYLAPAGVLLLTGVIQSLRAGRVVHLGWTVAATGAVVFLMLKAAVIDAWLGLAAGAAVAVWLVLRRSGAAFRWMPLRSAAIVATAAVFLVGAAAAVQVLAPRLHDRFTYLGVKAFSWHAAAWLWRDHAVAGAGPGEFQTRAPDVMSRVYARWTGSWGVRPGLVEPHDEAFAHQDFLQMLAERGALGFGAWVWLVAVAVRAGRSDPARFPFLAALAAFLPTMCFHFPLHLASSALLFWLCLGWAGGIGARSTGYKVQSLAPGEDACGTASAAAVAAVLVIGGALLMRGVTANVYLGHGYRMFRGGAAERAVPLFERFARLAPHHYEGAFYAGALYQALGRDVDAIDSYERAISLYPGMQGAIYNLGNLYFKRENYEQAIATYSRVIEVNPRMADAYNNRGNAQALLGRRDAAVRDYLKAVGVSPGHLDAMFNLAAAAHRAGERNEARRWLKRVLDLDPGYRPARSLAPELGL